MLRKPRESAAKPITYDEIELQIRNLAKLAKEKDWNQFMSELALLNEVHIADAILVQMRATFNLYPIPLELTVRPEKELLTKEYLANPDNLFLLLSHAITTDADIKVRENIRAVLKDLCETEELRPVSQIVALSAFGIVQEEINPLRIIITKQIVISELDESIRGYYEPKNNIIYVHVGSIGKDSNNPEYEPPLTNQGLKDALIHEMHKVYEQYLPLGQYLNDLIGGRAVAIPKPMPRQAAGAEIVTSVNLGLKGTQGLAISRIRQLYDLAVRSGEVDEAGFMDIGLAFSDSKLLEKGEPKISVRKISFDADGNVSILKTLVSGKVKEDTDPTHLFEMENHAGNLLTLYEFLKAKGEFKVASYIFNADTDSVKISQRSESDSVNRSFSSLQPSTIEAVLADLKSSDFSSKYTKGSNSLSR